MILALATATDPLGLVEAGGPPAAYEPLATAVAATLPTGGDRHDVRELCTDATDAAALDAFARTTISWWIHDAPTRRSGSAG